MITLWIGSLAASITWDLLESSALKDEKLRYIMNCDLLVGNTKEQETTIQFLNALANKICEKNKMEKPQLITENSSDFNASAIALDKYSSYVCFNSSLLDKDHSILSMILAHEIGHLKNNHSKKDNIRYFFFKYIFFCFFILFLAVTTPVVEGSIFVQVFTISMLILNLFTYNFTSQIVAYYINNLFSRMQEFSCDIFAAREVGLENYLLTNHFFQDNTRKDVKKVKLWTVPYYAFTKELTKTHPSWILRRHVVKLFVKKS